MKPMNFSKTSVENAVEAIKKHQNEFEEIRQKGSDMSVEEIAQQLIINKFGDAQIEAEEIVNDLKKGLANFDDLFNKNKETESINVKEYLQETTKNYSEEERKNCYVNILTSLELLKFDNLSEKEVNAKLSANAELSTDELIDKIESVLNNNISLESLTEKVKEGVNADTISKIAHEIELHKDEYRLMAAVYLYVEQREGNLHISDSEFSMSAEGVGALAGAAIEMIITNNALNEGEIDLTTWQKVVKWILGAALGITLGYAVMMLILGASVWATTFLMSTLGTSVVAAIFSLIAVAYIGCKAAGELGEMWADVMIMYSDFYDEYIGVVTEKVANWITTLKSWIIEITNKTKSALQGNKATDDETQPEAPQVETETENKEPDAQIEPAMA